MAQKNTIAAKDNETSLYTFSSLFKNTPLGIIVIEDNGIISYANKMMEDILELSGEQIAGKPFNDLGWKPLDENGVGIPFDKWLIFLTFQVKKSQINTEHIFENNGKLKWLRVNTTPILEPDGSVNKVLAYFKDITEEKYKHLKIQQSEANLRAVLNLSDHGYILVSSKMEIVMFNKMAEKLFHLISSLSLREGNHFPSLLTVGQRTQVEKGINDALRGDFTTKEYHIKTSQSKEKWVMISYLPQTIKTDRSHEQVLVEIKNISKDRELEHKLDGANEELVHLMNNSLKSFFIVDEDYKIIQYNKHAENETKQYFGRKPKKNESILPYIAETYLPKFKQNVHTAAQGNRIKEEEERQVAPGLQFYFEVEFFPSINKRSKKNNVGFSTTNITEKKMTRQMLLKSVSELNKYKGAFYEACNVAIIDLLGKIQDVNDHFCSLFLYSKPELLGNTLYLVFPEDENRITKLLSEFAASGKMAEATLQGKTKDGLSFSSSFRIYPVKDDMGKVVELILVSPAQSDNNK